MNDDWRLRVNLHEEESARALSKRLRAFDLAHDLKTSFHDRVVVSRDGPELFCYTDSREQAEAAERAIRSLAHEHGLEADCELRRWHPVAESWEDPDAPLPQTREETAAERAELMARERAESSLQGYPEFEVRVQCDSAEVAARLAEQLEAEGLPTLHRGRFIVLGAGDEASANALAERIRGQAPPGTSVVAEGSVAETTAESPLQTPFNPFAVFGGLGG
jgi:hypothetical protein